MTSTRKSAAKRAANTAEKTPAGKGQKADPFALIVDELRELAKREDLPVSYAGRHDAIANRLENAVKRSRV